MITEQYIKKNANRELREIDLQQMVDGHRFLVDWSGRRSRKTRNKKRKMYDISMAPENEGNNYYQAAPTHDQAREIFWQDLLSFTKPLNPWVNYSQLSITYRHNGVRVRVVGLNKPERIEGSPNNGIHITEMPELGNIGVWDNHIYPTLVDTQGFAWVDGTPDFRFPWYQEFIERYYGGRVPQSKAGEPICVESLIDPEWVFYHWQSIDVLGEKEIFKIKEQTDPISFRQEYEGEFIKQGGLVYYGYTGDNFSDEVYKQGRKTILCYDFNVNPMSIIVVQETSPDSWCAVKEFVLFSSNTRAASEKVAEFLGNPNHLEVTGDYTGGAHKTNQDSGVSDWTIITDIFKNYNGYKKRIRNVSKRLRDSINATNAMFKNANGEIKLRVNRKECPYLHKDLTRQVYKQDGTLNDENGDIGHRSDAIRYFAFNYYPIQPIFEAARRI
jgi:hypothetical protein